MKGILLAMVCAPLAALAQDDNAESAKAQAEHMLAAGPPNPVTSVHPISGDLISTAPLLDALSATLSTSKDGTTLKASFAPFALLTADAVLSSVRLDASTGVGKQQTATAGLSASYGTTQARWALGDDELKAIRATCKSDPGGVAALLGLAMALREEMAAVTGSAPEAQRANETVERFAARIGVAWQNVKQAAAAGTDVTKGDAIRAQLTKALDAIHGSFADCLQPALIKKRFEQAYDGSFSIRLRASGSMFPAVSGPAVTDSKTGVSSQPEPNWLAGWGLDLTGTFFFNSRLAAWLTLGISSSRDAPTTADLSQRRALGLSAAYDLFREPVSLPEGKLSSPYSKGVAVGVEWRWTACHEDRGCSDDVVGYASGTVNFDHVYSTTPFVDFRVSSDITLRASMQILNYTLKATPPGGDGGTHIQQISPSLSANVASWTL